MVLVKEFLAFVRERQAIFRRRERGEPKPWTKDKHLQAYKFCNVFRHLDRTSIWLENWYKENSGSEWVPFAAVMARLVNLPASLEELGFPETFSKAHFVSVLKARAARGEPMIGAAYIINPGPKGVGLANHLGEILVKARRLKATWVVKDSLKETWTNLKKVDGIGPFIANEVVADLRRTRWLKNANDTMTWAYNGPGSRRGLNRIFTRPVQQRISEAQLLSEMLGLIAEVKNLSSVDPLSATVDLRNIEDMCCEFDKYQRVRAGEGTTREMYDVCNDFSVAGTFRSLIMEGTLTDAEIFSRVIKRWKLPADWHVKRKGYVTWYRNELREDYNLNPPVAVV